MLSDVTCRALAKPADVVIAPLLIVSGPDAEGALPWSAPGCRRQFTVVPPV